VSKDFLFLQVATPTGWLPSMVFYECDHMPKGLALFTSWLAAQPAKANHEAGSKLPCEIKVLGADVAARDYYNALLAYLGDHKKALQFPVYVDVPDSYAKGLYPKYPTLERFLLRHFQKDIPWDMAFVRCEKYYGCTVCLLKSADGKFMAVTMKGDHHDRAAISAAIEDAMGTTEQRYYTRTKMSLDEDVVLKEARGFIDRIPMR